MSQIAKYLASIGKRGGEAGKGKSKTRTKAQYKAMAAKSAQVRKAKSATDSGQSATERKK